MKEKRIKIIIISTVVGLCLLTGGFIDREMKIRDIKKQNEILVSENEELITKINSYERPEPLNNCPLCDSAELEIKHDYAFGYHILCHGCYLQTGDYETEHEVIEAWNSLRKIDVL